MVRIEHTNSSLLQLSILLIINKRGIHRSNETMSQPDQHLCSRHAAYASDYDWHKARVS